MRRAAVAGVRAAVPARVVAAMAAAVMARPVGHPAAFIIALAAVIVWAISGPIFGFSDKLPQARCDASILCKTEDCPQPDDPVTQPRFFFFPLHRRVSPVYSRPPKPS